MRIITLFVTSSLILLASASCNQNNQNDQQENSENKESQTHSNQASSQTNPSLESIQQPELKEVSDNELSKFAAIAQEVQLINQAAQQKMIQVVESKGMDVERFSQIQQAQQNPQLEMEVSAEELETYEASTQEFQGIQMDAESVMEKKINEGDLSLTRYQEIAQTLQSDPVLLEKFQAIQQQRN